VPLVWDTSVASRLYPGARHHDALLERAEDDPCLLGAPTVMEIFRGLASPGEERLAALADWFTELVNGPAVEVLPFDGDAAQVAGEIAGRTPLPPRPRRRGDTKASTRAGWMFDVQIAATAWVHGHGVLTENVGDFEAIARITKSAYPGTPELKVVAAE
jgi:predicted nucleic acid-binding protein